VTKHNQSKGGDAGTSEAAGSGTVATRNGALTSNHQFTVHDSPYALVGEIERLTEELDTHLKVHLGVVRENVRLRAALERIVHSPPLTTVSAAIFEGGSLRDIARTALHSGFCNPSQDFRGADETSDG